MTLVLQGVPAILHYLFVKYPGWPFPRRRFRLRGRDPPEQGVLSGDSQGENPWCLIRECSRGFEPLPHQIAPDAIANQSARMRNGANAFCRACTTVFQEVVDKHSLVSG